MLLYLPIVLVALYDVLKCLTSIGCGDHGGGFLEQSLRLGINQLGRVVRVRELSALSVPRQHTELLET